MDTPVIAQTAVLDGDLGPDDELQAEGRPLRGVVVGSILSAALWAGLILTGAALIR